MKERPLNKDELKLLAVILTSVEVTHEDLPRLRHQIGEIRESEGLDYAALKAILHVKESVEEIGAKDQVPYFYWERH